MPCRHAAALLPDTLFTRRSPRLLLMLLMPCRHAFATLLMLYVSVKAMPAFDADDFRLLLPLFIASVADVSLI